MLKKHLIFSNIVLAVLATSSAWAEGGDRLPYFKQLCQEEKRIGFRWNEGAWEPGYFDREKLAYPTDELTDIGSYIRCTKRLKGGEYSDSWGTARVYNACLRLKALYDDGIDQVLYCEEYHQKRGGLWETRLFCKNSAATGTVTLTLLPGGGFQKSDLHWELAYGPEIKAKKPVVSSVGRCSDISDGANTVSPLPPP